MALKALAQMGNFFHVYDFRVKPGTADEFIRLFDEFDYSDDNPMHKSPAQVKDGVLCRDDEDPDHFYLLGEWNDKEAHYAIWKKVFESGPMPERFSLVEGDELRPVYATVVA